MKRLYLLFIIVGVFLNTVQGYSQNNLYGHKKERKRVWKKWRKNKQSYNPYLEKKARNKPSAVLKRSEKREMKQQKRGAKRQMRRSKKRLKR